MIRKGDTGFGLHYDPATEDLVVYNLYYDGQLHDFNEAYAEGRLKIAPGRAQMLDPTTSANWYAMLDMIQSKGRAENIQVLLRCAVRRRTAAEQIAIGKKKVRQSLSAWHRFESEQL